MSRRSEDSESEGEKRKSEDILQLLAKHGIPRVLTASGIAFIALATSLSAGVKLTTFFIQGLGAVETVALMASGTILAAMGGLLVYLEKRSNRARSN